MPPARHPRRGAAGRFVAAGAERHEKTLHHENLDTNDEVTVPHATGGTFSPDSGWLASQVDPGASQPFVKKAEHRDPLLR